MNTRAAWYVVAIIVIIAIVWFIVARRGSQEADNAGLYGTSTEQGTSSYGASSSPASTGTEESAESGSGIALSPVRPGKTVTVSSVTLPAAGFVVIEESAASGQPGKVIGASGLLPAGRKSGVAIALNQGVKAGDRIYAIVYKDNGDKAFKLQSDTAATNASGQPLAATAIVSASTSSPSSY